MKMTDDSVDSLLKARLEEILQRFVDGPEKVIADAISGSTPDRVRDLAKNGGLVSNEMRRVAWPFLLSDRPFTEEVLERRPRDSKSEIETFKQIDLDVHRSVEEKYCHILKEFLIKFFTKHDDLCFYQGFADIAWAVLRIMTNNGQNESNIPLAHFVLSRLSRNFFFRDAHRASFDCIYAMLESVKTIVTHADIELANIWKESESTSFWAISPLVCLFAHDVVNTSLVGRLLDEVIASENQLDCPIYMVAALPLLPSVRAKLLAGDRDSATVHTTMLDASKELSDAEELISIAKSLREKVPPRFLLKTARASGLPRDSIFELRNAADPMALTKKRSWRTFSFFSSGKTVEVKSH